MELYFVRITCKRPAVQVVADVVDASAEAATEQVKEKLHSIVQSFIKQPVDKAAMFKDCVVECVTFSQPSIIKFAWDLTEKG